MTDTNSTPRPRGALRRWIAAAALAALATPAAALDVDVELVLAVDVSGSMDRDEQEFQRQGYVSALRSPEFWQAVRSGAWRRIALTYVEWAGSNEQVVVMSWKLIDSPEAAAAFADGLAARPINLIHATSISAALTFSARLFDENGFDGWRRVIDVSGDGVNNQGEPVIVARDAVVARGITINGLPLLLRPETIGAPLDSYYAACVVGGPGAFSVPVRGKGEFARAIRRKLVMEIAGVAPPQVIRVGGRVQDCANGGWLP
jgi:hypothetical protein